MIRLSGLKLIFISSLVILAAVFIATIYLIPSQLDLAVSKNIQIIDGENEWILQYDIFNNEERDIAYTILVTAYGTAFSDKTLVAPGREYTYILHIPHQEIGGEVTLTAYEDGRQEPIEQATYHLDIE